MVFSSPPPAGPDWPAELKQIPLAEAQPGDIAVFDTRGTFGRLIQVGEWLRHKSRLFRRVHHMAVVREYIPNNPTDRGDPANWVVIQAARRVDRAYLDTVANGRPFAILRCPDGVDRQKVVEQADALLGVKYAVLSIISIAFNLLTPNLIRIDLRRGTTFLCSALVAFCLHAGGWLHAWPDIYQVMPSEVTEALSA